MVDADPNTVAIVLLLIFVVVGGLVALGCGK